MSNDVVIWQNHNIKKVELSEDAVNEIFNRVYTCNLTENFCELFHLEDGIYLLEDVNEYFEIVTREAFNSTTKWKEITVPFLKDSVIHYFLQETNERAFQEAEGEILSEIILFNNDLNSELVFVDGKAKMKNYYNKTVELKISDDGEGDIDLFLDGKLVVNIFYDEVENKYSAYDGVDGFGWHNTIKEAVKYYMDCCYSYKNPFSDDDDYYEVVCSNCGDGGCLYCEPNRFL